MNECPKVGGGEGPFNVHLWVSEAATASARVDQRRSFGSEVANDRSGQESPFVLFYWRKRTVVNQYPRRLSATATVSKSVAAFDRGVRLNVIEVIKRILLPLAEAVNRIEDEASVSLLFDDTSVVIA
jgi:hypothetical protein